MLIIKGRHKGRSGTVHQYADNQVTVSVVLRGTPTQVSVSPAHVRLEPGERAIFENYALNGTGSVGKFWAMWRLEGDTFVALPARTPKPVRPARRARAGAR